MKSKQLKRAALLSLGVLLGAASTARATSRTPDVQATFQAGFGLFEPNIGSRAARKYHESLYEAATHEKFMTFTRYVSRAGGRKDFGQLGMRFQLGQWEVRSENDDSLRVTPLSLGAAYRNDILSRRWKIPLIPYAAAGIASYVWSGSGAFRLIDASAGSGNSSLDAASGTFANAGVNLDLSVFTPRAFKSSRIKTAALFLEWHRTWLTNFGAAPSDVRLDLSATQVRMGLTLDL